MTTPPAPSPGAGPSPAAQAPPPGSPPAPGAAAAPGAGPPPPADSHADAGAGPVAEQESYAVGAGGEAAAATSRYGEGSRRGEYLREARSWDISGDYVGGDYVSGVKEHIEGVKNVYMFGGRPESRLSPLPSRLIRLIRDAFVPPACMAGVQAAFGKRRAAVLRGPDGYGKHGLAIHLLLESCTGVFQVDRSADLTRLREWIETGDGEHQHIIPGAGVILDQPLDKAHLHGSVLQGLEEVLERAGARLILTVGPEAAVPDELHDYIIDVASAPDCEEVVSRHLRHRLGTQPAARLLAGRGNQEFIRQQLGPHPACRQAAGLAAAIVEARGPEDTQEIDKAKVQDVMSRRGTEAFDAWFSGLGDTQSRCFAVALAVLNGLAYDTVAKAARALYRRFGTHPYTVMIQAHEPPPDGQRPFLLSRGEWEHRLRAEITETRIKGSYGKSVTATIEYRDETYPGQVIRRAWADYQAQEALLGWLSDMAADNLEQVRIFAGKALGLLALRSFDHLTVHVLNPWAAGGQHQREAVAYALSFATACDPSLGGNVKELISGWYGDPGKPAAQATAARAYGLARGVFGRSDAFKALVKLARVDDIRVAIAVGDAIADLLDDSPPTFACQVLGGLAGCLENRAKSAAIQLVFLIVADALVTPVRTEAQEEPWPYLLDLVTRQPPARAALVRLWRHVINAAQFAGEAFQVLTQWAAAAEAAPGMREAFLRLVRAVSAGDQRSQMIFARYAAQWDSDDNFRPLPEISAAVQAVLEAERSPR